MPSIKSATVPTSTSATSKFSFAAIGSSDTNIWKLTLEDPSKTVTVTSGSSVTKSGQNYGLTAFVERLYKNILGRTYDEDGLNYWCDRILTGTDTIDNVSTVRFFHSTEFSDMKKSYGL